jgi:hypothetical protein
MMDFPFQFPSRIHGYETFLLWRDYQQPLHLLFSSNRILIPGFTRFDEQEKTRLSTLDNEIWNGYYWYDDSNFIVGRISKQGRPGGVMTAGDCNSGFINPF